MLRIRGEDEIERSSPLFFSMKQNFANEQRIQYWLNCLRSSGYRITRPLGAVVDALANSDRALNAAEIFDIARENATKSEKKLQIAT